MNAGVLNSVLGKVAKVLQVFKFIELVIAKGKDIELREGVKAVYSGNSIVEEREVLQLGERV